jgi:hypothetical protein
VPTRVQQLGLIVALTLLGLLLVARLLLASG